MPRDGAAIIIRPTRPSRISAILSATSWPTKVTPSAAYGRVKTTGTQAQLAAGTRAAAPVPIRFLRSLIGSFGIVSNAPVTGPKKEFAIGVNDWRRLNLKRCRGFYSASKSTESGRSDGVRIVRAVED